MSAPLTITYSTPDDRTGVVAEIWSGDDQVAEVCDDPGCMLIEIYPHKSGRPWKFKLEELTRTISEATAGLRREKR